MKNSFSFFDFSHLHYCLQHLNLAVVSFLAIFNLNHLLFYRLLVAATLAICFQVDSTP